MKSTFFLAHLLAVVLSVTAQATDAPETTPSPPPPASASFRIERVEYTVHGWTDPNALDRFLDWDRDKVFSSFTDLELYLEEKRRLLANNRIFQETRVEYAIATEPAEGPAVVTVTVEVTDTWNILALPIPKYSDNEGLNLSLRVRDNNFLGTMEQLRLNLEFKRSTGGTNSLGGSLDFRIPLDVGDELWFLGIEGSGYYKTGNLIDLTAGWTFAYPFSVGEQIFQYSLGQRVSVSDSKNTELTFFTALSTGIKLGDSRLTITPSQSMKIFTDYSDPDGYFTTTRLDASIGLPVPILPKEWGATYSPGIYLYTQYLFDKPISFSRSGLYGGFRHSLSFGRWDWVENFRRGALVQVSHTAEYNFGQDRPENQVNLSGTLYWDLFGVLGLSTRVIGLYHQNAGDFAKMEPVRGVIDSSIQGNIGAFANADFTVRLLRVDNFQDWWGWRWMRFFNFEMHLTVFSDVGYIFPGLTWTWDDTRWVWTSGLEIVGFPLAARSYFMRLSYGVNLRKLTENDYNVLSGNVRELFIGLGHHY